MFTHNLLQRSMVAAIMDGKVGWENGRAGLCAGISFEIPLFQVALMEASLAALRMVRAEKLSHNTSLFAEIWIRPFIHPAYITCPYYIYLNVICLDFFLPEKPSHAQLAIGESISEALTCTRGVYLWMFRIFDHNPCKLHNYLPHPPKINKHTKLSLTMQEQRALTTQPRHFLYCLQYGLVSKPFGFHTRWAEGVHTLDGMHGAFQRFQSLFPHFSCRAVLPVFDFFGFFLPGLM